MSEQNHLVVMNHAHPEYSNETQDEVMGFPGINHQADYKRLAEELPEGFDLFFTVSNHYATEGGEYWDELRQELAMDGADVYPGDRVFRAEHDGTRMWGVHSVEGAYEGNLEREYLVHGVPLNDEQEYLFEDDVDALNETERAEVGTVPHPFFLDFDWGEEARESFFEAAGNFDVNLSFEHSHGYGLVDHIANQKYGVLGEDTSDLAERYDVPEVPGADWHASTPRTIATMDRSAIDDLEDDNFPTEQFLDMSLYSRGGVKGVYDRAVDTAGAVATFSDMVPIVGDRLPVGEAEMEKVRDWTAEAWSSLDPEDVARRKTRING